MILAAKLDFMQVKIGSDFLIILSFPLYWASLQFEDRSEDTPNFPETLHCFSTSCAKRYKISEPANILTL